LHRAIFESFDKRRQGWALALDHPQTIYSAGHLDEVIPVLQTAEEAAQCGKWVAIALSYDAAPAFDPALIARRTDSLPLVWVAIYDRVTSLIEEPPAPYLTTGWEPQITRDEYARAIHRLRDYIAAGDAYQVNYTFPLTSHFKGDSRDWYRELGAAQGAGYSAFIDLGRYQLLSFSPELFFERHKDRVTTRPMKGTIARGRWMEEDRERAQELAESPKNRAENLMIVDLLRNDLGRVAVAGTVRVPELFTVERYETLWQMTSGIEAQCRPGTSLTDLLRALFPCGSITGAPKVRAVQIIRELEPAARGFYTGAIGLLRPGGDCVFNVAIRTILLDTLTGTATFGVGGGITWDSTVAGEYDECLLKASFLNVRRPEFELLETMLLDEGTYFLLDRHLARARLSADYFGFAWDESAARDALDRVRTECGAGQWKVRALFDKKGRVRIEVESLTASEPKKYRVAFAAEPIETNNPFLYHKTTHREVYENARRSRPDCDEAILWNERGEVTESVFGNVVLVDREGKWTPPRSAGLFAGTFRNELIANGELRERVITREELLRVRSFYLINSVRRWMPAIFVD
jgi:para-aminobenzoate synthetase/4-amino-4-deoxychorismate lyase